VCVRAHQSAPVGPHPCKKWYKSDTSARARGSKERWTGAEHLRGDVESGDPRRVHGVWSQGYGPAHLLIFAQRSVVKSPQDEER
jgi:hypothetical protein